MRKPKATAAELRNKARMSMPCVCEDYCRCDVTTVVDDDALDEILAAARAEAVAPLEARVKELERDLALMTHSRDGFREAVIAGESTSRDMKSLMRRPDHADGCKLDGCALVGECFHGAALAEVSRLRETLERIANGVWPIGGYDDMTGADHMREIAREAQLTAEVSRLREALENAADDGHHAMCETMRLYRGCTCHQAETLKALGLACPACDGEGVVLSADRVRMHCGACDASGRAALATATTKGG